MKKKTILGLCLASALAAGTAGWLWWGNRAVMVHTISVTDRNLTHAFEGFRIAQISDLHNEVFGAGNGQLLTLLAETKPDVIVITGDLIDSRHTDVDAALEFARGAVELAPVYYVPGNHESRLPEEFWMLERSLDQMGVHVLRGERAILTRQGAAIALIGVDDPTFQDKNSARWPELLEAELERLASELDRLTQETEAARGACAQWDEDLQALQERSTAARMEAAACDAEQVTVRAFDRTGKEVTYTRTGMTARAICHECDHLDGIMYVSKVEGKLYDTDPDLIEEEEE